MTASPFTCVVDARATVGECPTWSIAEQALYWADIDAPALNRYDPSTGANEVMPMPSSIGSFGLRSRGGFVVALRDGVWLADSRGRLERRIAAAPYDPDHHRFNDGRVDPRGRFWVGTMNERRDAASGALYRLDGESLVRVLDGVTVSNGLAWSPDGRTMYHADTPEHVVRAYDFDADRAIPARPREFARWHGETDRPDGATVDRDGCYWVAFFRGGKVLRLDPSGRVVREIPVPAMCPTMPAFGGPTLRTLYVTTARGGRPDDELARWPRSGGIFAMEVDVPGLPEPLCTL